MCSLLVYCGYIVVCQFINLLFIFVLIYCRIFYCLLYYRILWILIIVFQYMFVCQIWNYSIQDGLLYYRRIIIGMVELIVILWFIIYYYVILYYIGLLYILQQDLQLGSLFIYCIIYCILYDLFLLLYCIIGLYYLLYWNMWLIRLFGYCIVLQFSMYYIMDVLLLYHQFYYWIMVLLVFYYWIILWILFYHLLLCYIILYGIMDWIVICGIICIIVLYIIMDGYICIILYDYSLGVCIILQFKLLYYLLYLIPIHAFIEVYYGCNIWIYYFIFIGMYGLYVSMIVGWCGCGGRNDGKGLIMILLNRTHSYLILFSMN